MLGSGRQDYKQEDEFKGWADKRGLFYIYNRTATFH